MTNNIAVHTIEELLSTDKYIIPIYQRNYAWSEAEVTQLIQDIVDFSINKPENNYYIGTLVVFERGKDNGILYETIDGQQRLTTLFILLSVIKHEYNNICDINAWFKLNLKFSSREASTEILQKIFKHPDKLNLLNTNSAIKQAYKDASKSLKRILADNNNYAIEKFCNYLFKNVMILRVPVPKDTNLNHYFEIMNSRGEQLEKHEILKSRCLEKIKEDKALSYAFNLIWEACSNMERYVQYGFSVEQRHLLFGKNDWNTFTYNNLDEISEVLKKQDSSKQGASSITLNALLERQPDNNYDNKSSTNNDDSPDRFSTVINFSNFLLHVLRLQVTVPKNIALDDKRLIELFNFYLKDNENAIGFVKQFGFNLLKCKFLFDKYIIKREFLKDNEKWSLKKLKWNDKNSVSYVNTFGDDNGNQGENRSILMLLAMFHVSSPTLVYKYWLNASLKYVFEKTPINSNDYKIYLENLAKAFLYDRFLSKEPKDYFEIIYTNNGVCKNTDFDISPLNRGTAVENFIFNYLDYLLWKKESKEYCDFEFTFRSSVEHYYPQHPIENNKIDNQYLDNFGNLCLISSSKNSRLSNYMPLAKTEHYRNSASIDSIKQKIMMEITISGEKKWEGKEIEAHSNAMIEILKDKPVTSQE